MKLRRMSPPSYIIVYSSEIEWKRPIFHPHPPRPRRDFPEGATNRAQHWLACAAELADKFSDEALPVPVAVQLVCGIFRDYVHAPNPRVRHAVSDNSTNRLLHTSSIACRTLSGDMRRKHSRSIGHGVLSQQGEHSMGVYKILFPE